MGTGLISGERRLEYSELARRCARAIGGFKSLGLKRGERVALILRNDFTFLEAGRAVSALGAYPVPINWNSVPEEVGYILEDSMAKVIVVHADLYRSLCWCFPDGAQVLAAPTPREILQEYKLDPMLGTVPSGVENWDAWRDRHAPAESEIARSAGYINYTSGTTGYPKGVKRMAPTAEQYEVWLRQNAEIFGFTGPGDVALVTGPLYHVGPHRLCVYAITQDIPVVLQPRFDPEAMLALVERHRVTHMHMAPFMFRRLLKLADSVRRRYDISSLKRIVHGAAPCPRAIKRMMIEWWGPILFEYYASTETHVVALCGSEEWLERPGTVGKAVKDCTIKILDERGRPLPAGKVGEIYAWSNALTDFTYNRDLARRKDCERQGLVSVGDLGYVDEDGYLFVKDRKSEVIHANGKTIYPSDIEAALLEHSGVRECAVIGIPDPKVGEAVCAVIEPEPGVHLDEFAIHAYLHERLESAQVPARVEFSARLPREDSGKLFKRKLRDPHWAGHGRRL
jgi:long-chain acyl-CoA synthetase